MNPETSEHRDRRERRILECNLYIASDEEDPSTEEEKEEEGDDKELEAPVEESQVPDDLPREENQEEPEEDRWLCPSCESSPCEFLQAQEEMERVVSIMAADSTNRAKRFHTYQFMTRRIHGQLRKKERIPLPACCKDGIAELFPSEDGKYTGFRHAEA
jgi:hypothetical protein